MRLARLNCTPKVKQYGILKNKGVHFHAKGRAEQAIHSGIQEESD